MRPSNRRAPARLGDPLTPREQEVLGLLATGHGPDEIAARLGIAPATCRHHVNSVYKKIGARRGTDRDRSRLTRRQHQILALLAAGHSTSDIARQLGVTTGTVKTHLTAIYKKIGAANRVQATLYYLEHRDSLPDPPR